MVNANEAKRGLFFKTVRHRHFNYNGGVCVNCGATIHLPYAYASIAHLLPKAIFKSVETHTLVYMILGAECGCHNKTHRIDTFIKMKIWPEAAWRIKQLIPLLTPEESSKLPQDLLIALAAAPDISEPTNINCL